MMGYDVAVEFRLKQELSPSNINLENTLRQIKILPVSLSPSQSSVSTKKQTDITHPT